MAHPADCPVFDYQHHPRHREVLVARIAELVNGLRRLRLDTCAVAQDSRPIHRLLFTGLTPLDYDYYAGHYRGEAFRCLRDYEVVVPSDPRVGLPPDSVLAAMDSIAQAMGEAIETLDTRHRDPAITAGDRLVSAVQVACEALEVVLRVHPYANGNGHAARFVVWAILGRYGYWLRNWPIEPRPDDPPYTTHIVEYRNGNHAPLETFLLRNLLPTH